MEYIHLTAGTKYLRLPTVIHGKFDKLPSNVKAFIVKESKWMMPDNIWICDGTFEESQLLLQNLQAVGTVEKLPAYDDVWLARTDPKDVARVESKTFICTRNKHDAICDFKEGTNYILGNWLSLSEAEKAMEERFPGCMKGRTMYVIPYSMGPLGSPLSKIGVQLTDSAYVAVAMRVMTRMGSTIFDILGEKEFVKCVHSVGVPLPTDREVMNHWPCCPEQTIIMHFPLTREIISFGSGYGGNSLLGKKCFALRIAMKIAHDEGWLAEHMLILGITNPQGEEKFIAAAFPSACGKTNLAMIESKVPGWSVRCVGDDIAWMKFDSQGVLRGINPEAGFFGVAPGTNNKSNPNALATCQSHTIMTNVGKTADGHFYWEGLEDDFPKDTEIESWLGEKTYPGGPIKSAHPNSRFCCPARQCPVIHPRWEDPAGVPIEAIIFGGRRPEGVPLVYESFSWNHGVFVGAAMKSESTAAAEHTGKKVMHDPMAMRPFMGYNFGEYLHHWISIGQDPGHKLPKIFHVNWFRADANGKFIWPGFGENVRVLDWVFRRCNGEESTVVSPIGLLPKPDAINTAGLSNVDMKTLLSIPKDYYMEDIVEIKTFLEAQVGHDLPVEIAKEMAEQEKRIRAM